MKKTMPKGLGAMEKKIESKDKKMDMKAAKMPKMGGAKLFGKKAKK
jgi:hypothetical protein